MFSWCIVPPAVLNSWVSNSCAYFEDAPLFLWFSENSRVVFPGMLLRNFFFFFFFFFNSIECQALGMRPPSPLGWCAQLPERALLLCRGCFWRVVFITSKIPWINWGQVLRTLRLFSFFARSEHCWWLEPRTYSRITSWKTAVQSRVIFKIISNRENTGRNRSDLGCLNNEYNQTSTHLQTLRSGADWLSNGNFSHRLLLEVSYIHGCRRHQGLFLPLPVPPFWRMVF